jgi:hypothetical protein
MESVMESTRSAATAFSPLDSDQFPSLIGDLYARWTLDGLVEMAYAISIDVINRPAAYRGSLPSEIISLRMSYGTEPELPNTAQRQAMMMPILGKSDGIKPDAVSASTQFYSTRKSFFDACIAVQKATVDIAIPTLEAVARTEILAFRGYLDDLNVASVVQSAQQIAEVSDTAIKIITSPGVVTAFGSAAPRPGWPLTSIDSNGARLVDAIGKALALAPEYKLSFPKFNALQILAQIGNKTLPLVLTIDVESEKDLRSLIGVGYEWSQALAEYYQTP